MLHAFLNRYNIMSKKITAVENTNAEIDKYYKLKSEYEEQFKTRLKTLKKSKSSIEQKRTNFKNFIPKCIFCKDTGGTTFDKTDEGLVAVCISTKKVHMKIEMEKYEDIKLVVKDIEQTLNELCISIIRLKTDKLFRFNKDDEDTFVTSFNDLRDIYARLSMRYSTISSKLKSILTHSKNTILVGTLHNQFETEISQLKTAYDTSPHTQNTFDRLAEFQKTIQDLSDKIMNAAYEYTYVRTINKTPSGIKNNIGEQINVLVKDIYTLNQLIIPF